MRPFGSHVLPGLRTAEETADWDATVEIVNRRMAGLDTAHVEACGPTVKDGRPCDT